MKPIHTLLALTSVSLSVCLTAQPASACTAFQLQARDGSWVYFRSMEFGLPFNSRLLIVPRGTKFTGTAGASAPGLKWTAKYGVVGPNQEIATGLMSDGMNEQGLVVGMLLFPGYAQYPDADPAKANTTLGSWEVATYLLSTCSTLDECKTALTDGSMQVANTPFAPFGGVLPVHYYIADKSGAVLIAEFVGGKLQLHDNPLGVLTNSPSFDWHLVNLANYVNLSAVNASTLDLHRDKVAAIGQGSGALGLPGDWTPPSRFVRAALFSQWVTPAATATDTVLAGLHVLGTFDIFAGAIQSNSASAEASSDIGNASNAKQPPIVPNDTTQWIIAHDRANLRTYVRTYESLSIQVIDLKKIDFTTPGLRQIELQKEFAPQDISEAVLPLK